MDKTPNPSAAPATATAAPATPAEPTAAPLPTMDPALIGTWEGELKGVHGPVEHWAVRHMIAGPCAVIDERCGTWEMSGTVTSELDWAPWAALGENVTCRGQLRYRGMLAEAAVLLAAVEASGSSDDGCGVWLHRLRLETADAVRLEVTAPGYGVGSQAKWGAGVLDRVDATPSPSGS